MASTKYSLAQTIIFDEENNGFESFVSYHPEMMVSIGTVLCSFKDGVLYTHDDEPFYNNFYGVQYDSTITPVFNQNELEKKTFLAVEQLATQAWDCPEIITSSNEYLKVKQVSELIVEDFAELEGNYNASFLRASNSEGGLLEGSSLKGNLMSIKFRAVNENPPNNTLISLNLVSVKAIDSPLTNK